MVTHYFCGQLIFAGAGSTEFVLVWEPEWNLEVIPKQGQKRLGRHQKQDSLFFLM
jgi:hypothetical protein